MKKHIYSLLFALTCYCSMGWSQSLKIIAANGNHSLNDSVVLVEGGLPTLQYKIPFWVINTSGSTINVKCKWYDSVYVTNTTNQICWVLCYGAYFNKVWTAPSTASMAPNDTNQTFVGYYNDSSNSGCEIIRYVFYNSANPTDSAWVLVKYCISPLAVEQLAENAMHISAPYPNPAGNFVGFNYRINSVAHLTIYNTIGQTIRDVLLSPSANKANLNVSDVSSGIYICKLSAEGAEPVYQKLVVSH